MGTVAVPTRGSDRAGIDSEHPTECLGMGETRCIFGVDPFVKDPAYHTGTMGVFVCRCIYTPAASCRGCPVEETPPPQSHGGGSVLGPVSGHKGNLRILQRQASVTTVH